MRRSRSSQPRQRRRGRRPGARARAATLRIRRPPSSIACRRIRPPSRRWRFPGARSTSPPPPARSALFDDKGEPQADIAYTAYQLNGADRAHPAGDLPVQWRAGRVLGLAAIRRRRTVAARHQRRRGDVLRVARSVAQRRDLARLHRSRLHRSRRHRLQPLRRDRRGGAQAVLFGRRRRQRDRAGDPPLAGEIRSPAVAEIRRRRKLWRHSRTEDRAQSADPAGRRGEGADPGLAAVRLPRIHRLQPAAICLEPSLDGGGGARGQGRR